MYWLLRCVGAVDNGGCFDRRSGFGQRTVSRCALSLGWDDGRGDCLETLQDQVRGAECFFCGLLYKVLGWLIGVSLRTLLQQG